MTDVHVLFAEAVRHLPSWWLWFRIGTFPDVDARAPTHPGGLSLSKVHREMPTLNKHAQSLPSNGAMATANICIVIENICLFGIETKLRDIFWCIYTSRGSPLFYKVAMVTIIIGKYIYSKLAESSHIM